MEHGPAKGRSVAFWSVLPKAHVPFVTTARPCGAEGSHLLRGLHRNWDNQLRQYREGFLSTNIPRSVRQAVLIEIAPIETARQHWEQREHAFSDEYIDFVDSVLAEAD